MTMENNHMHGGQLCLKLTLRSDEELDKYKLFLINHRERDPIPHGIFFHKSDANDASSYVVLEPNWVPLHVWINSLKSDSFWIKYSIHRPHSLSANVCMVLEDVLHGLQKSHQGGLYSGMINEETIQNVGSGIFVSGDGNAAVVVCSNRIKETVCPWASTSGVSSIVLNRHDEFKRIREDLLGFLTLFRHLVNRFRDTNIQIPAVISSFEELFIGYIPKCRTVPQLKRFEVYALRAPLFWPISRRVKFCNFMYAAFKKKLLYDVDFSKLKGWQQKVKDRGNNDTLYLVYQHNNSGGSFDLNDHTIVPFMRNAMHHQDSQNFVYGHQEAINILYEEYPDWFPKIYTATVTALGIQNEKSKVSPYSSFHELFVDEFDT